MRRKGEIKKRSEKTKTKTKQNKKKTNESINSVTEQTTYGVDRSRSFFFIFSSLSLSPFLLLSSLPSFLSSLLLFLLFALSSLPPSSSSFFSSPSLSFIEA